MRQPPIKVLLIALVAIAALWFLNSYLNARPDISESLKDLKKENILVLNQDGDDYSFYKIIDIKNGVIQTRSAITTVESLKIPTPTDLKGWQSGILDFFEGEDRNFTMTQIDSLKANNILVDVFKK